MIPNLAILVIVAAVGLTHVVLVWRLSFLAAILAIAAESQSSCAPAVEACCFQSRTEVWLVKLNGQAWIRTCMTDAVQDRIQQASMLILANLAHVPTIMLS